MPLIETKKALKGLQENESLKIIIDNETSVKNVVHFLNDNNIAVGQNTKADGVFELIVNTTEAIPEEVDETAYCSTCASNEKRDNYVVRLAKDRLGEGPDELGEALAVAMINTLKSMDTLPTKILVLNSGVSFVVNGSSVINDMRELEKAGVEIMVCGACLDYFDKMDELAVGKVSNMFDILDSMVKADKVISL